MKKLKNFIGRIAVRIIKFLARKTKIDLIRVAYAENGITKSHSYLASGEDYLINTFLKQKIKGNGIFLDVGANLGDYSSMLRNAFPKSQLYAFEPNPNAYKKLKERFDNKIQIVHQGVGKENGELELFYDAEDVTSVQATSDRRILEEISKTKSISSELISVTTLDDFCQLENIDHIDLLKIDTEGFEMEVLIGAKNLLSQGKIDFIQFEFNEVNIVKRRFLKDYYEILIDYDLYRLDENRLITLNDWQPIHEIFMFQNILAIKRSQ